MLQAYQNRCIGPLVHMRPTPEVDWPVLPLTLLQANTTCSQCLPVRKQCTESASKKASALLHSAAVMFCSCKCCKLPFAISRKSNICDHRGYACALGRGLLEIVCHAAKNWVFAHLKQCVGALAKSVGKPKVQGAEVCIEGLIQLQSHQESTLGCLIEAGQPAGKGLEPPITKEVAVTLVSAYQFTVYAIAQGVLGRFSKAVSVGN